MLTIMLVDDEALARDRLRRMLESESTYQVIAEAGNGDQAMALAAQHAPDIILMDIRMPGMDGLQVAHQLAALENPPAIIFCTAYDEYAINAFDVQAIGYLLKPVRKSLLLEAMTRAQRLSRVQMNALMAGESQRLEQSHRTHISVTTPSGLELLALEDISHFRADHKYVVAYCAGRERIVDESLKTLEQQFGERLLRIHRNCLVTITYIEAIRRNAVGQSQLRLRGMGEPLTVSRRHLAQVKAVMQEL